jgi:hypothetical protein
MCRIGTGALCGKLQRGMKSTNATDKRYVGKTQPGSCLAGSECAREGIYVPREVLDGSAEGSEGIKCQVQQIFLMLASRCCDLCCK